ncbi:UNVERIFIED_CONTAM: hypothetical protein FKN15_054967 [Acipenser sinensis]
MSPVHGPFLEAPEGPTHPQARPWKRAKIDICGLEESESMIVLRATVYAALLIVLSRESVGCWVNMVIDGVVDCIEDIDDRDFEKFGLMWSEKIENIFPEYMICARQGFFSGRPNCLKIAEEVFG